MRRLFRFTRRSRDDIRVDVDDELGFHIDARTEALIAEGRTPEDARAQALREFGDLEDARRYIAALDATTEAARRRRDWMSELRQDVIYALRKLRSSKVFAATAIITLALGIGANVAIFSMVKYVLLRPLPFPEPDALYRVWMANPSAGYARTPVSSPDIDDWRTQLRAVADVGAWWYADEGSGLDLTGLGEPQRLSVVFVTGGFFTTLGVPALSGRLPREEELVRGGRDRVVILAHGFWQRQFGGSRDVIGTSLMLGGQPYEVLGVMPPSFRYPSERADVYVPYSSIPDYMIPHVRGVRILGAVARAAPGVTQEAATSELGAIAARLASQYPENESYPAVALEPLHDSMTGPVRAGLFVLLGAVGFVLLIVCVNLASLLLARATTRGREIATRAALGAGRSRIVRQLLTESVVLAVIGGLAGIGVAQFATGALVRLSAGQIPNVTDVRLDAGVLLLALAVSVLTGLFFGLVPALRATSPNLQGTLREGGRGLASTEGRRLRNGLIIAEVALAVMLVVGAGLMTRSFISLLRVDPGFRPENLLAVNFTINTVRHPAPQHAIYYTQVLERVRALPGVISAGAVKDAPFRGEGERWGFHTPGMVIPAGEEPPSATVLHVSDGYFRTIGTPVEGREFTPDDRSDAPFVLVVNQALATRYFPGENAVGRSLVIDDEEYPIVGVVGDIRQSAMEEPGQPTIYVHNVQNTRIKTTLVVRTRGEPLALIGPVREAIWALDPDQTITSIFTFDDIVSEAVARPRLLTVLLVGFGILGLVLGALGIYGVLAYTVNQRQREIGMRLVLGADPGGVFRMIVGRGLALAAAGVAIGIVGALGLTRYIRGVLFGIEATDPLTFAGVTVVLLGVAAIASWLPARRAASVDPVVALRYD